MLFKKASLIVELEFPKDTSKEYMNDVIEMLDWFEPKKRILIIHNSDNILVVAEYRGAKKVKTVKEKLSHLFRKEEKKD